MVKTVAIVSLSRGTIGEGFVKHEIEIGLRRLEEFGLKVVLMPHAMSGIDYVEKHPEDRAADLIQAMEDDSVDMILCAIGGDDTYRLLPHLFDNDELKNAIEKHKKAVAEGRAKEKIILGFSDTTMNHLMLHKLGFKTFYGQSFLADVCELGETMYAYSEKYFKELIETGTIREVRPSDVWYDCRTEWGVDAIGTLPPVHENEGFQLL